MTFVIQSNVAGQLSVWFVDHDGTIRAQDTLPVEHHGSEQLLQLIDQSLRKNKLQLDDLEKIVVVRGPGNFTTVRTGLIVANTLSFILGAPVVGIIQATRLTMNQVQESATHRPSPNQGFARPWYGKEPNITRPKQRLTL